MDNITLKNKHSIKSLSPCSSIYLNLKPSVESSKSLGLRRKKQFAV